MSYIALPELRPSLVCKTRMYLYCFTDEEYIDRIVSLDMSYSVRPLLRDNYTRRGKGGKKGGVRGQEVISEKLLVG